MSSALSLSEVVDVVITLESAAVPQPAFAVPLILGTSDRYVDGVLIEYFSSAETMLIANGGVFQNTDPEYLKAVDLTAQAVVPSTFAVGCQAVASAIQKNTIAISAVTEDETYSVTVNNQTVTHSASNVDTTNTVLQSLNTAINALTGANVQSAYTASGAGSIAIQSYNATIQVGSSSEGAVWPGVGFSISIGGTGVSTMSNTATVPNASLVDGLQAIQNVDQGFYAVNICSDNWYDILNMASYIETQTLVFVAISADAAVGLSTCSFDVLSQLKGKGYNRTALLYTGDPSDNPDSAWTGANVPLPVGQSTWGNCSLAEVTPDNWSQSVFNTVAGKPGVTIAKNGNVYVTIGGNNVVLWGQAVSGRFFDITIGIDWLKAEIQGNIWGSIVAARQAGGKIPYSNKGAAIFVGDTKEAIDLGADQGLINDTDFPVVITVGRVQDQSLTQRTSRIAPPINFTCTLAGAFSTATVNGVLSV